MGCDSTLSHGGAEAMVKADLWERGRERGGKYFLMNEMNNNEIKEKILLTY